MSLRLSIAGLTVIAFGALAAHAQGAPATVTADPLVAAAESLRAVAPPAFVDDLACQFRPAAWGAVPVTVRLGPSITTDGKAYTFTMGVGGTLTRVRDSVSTVRDVAIERDYGVSFASAGAAFEKGAPMFLSDPVVEGDTALHLVVTSNPAVTLSYGQFAMQSTGPGYNVGSISDFVKSKPGPQRVTLRLVARRDVAKKLYVTVVDHDRHACVASNDVLVPVR